MPKRFNRLAALVLPSMTRREFVASSTATALACAASSRWSGAADAPRAIPRFQPVPLSVADRLIVPPDHEWQLLFAWGDPVSSGPAFRFDASQSAAEQAQQCGMHNDGMHLFALPGSREPDRGLLCINHEYLDHGLLFSDGRRAWSAEKVRKAQHANGVSVIEVQRELHGRWRVVRPSRYARRITARTPMRIAGPARGAPAMRTAADPQGEHVLGTFANCAHGATPWGTYLTCEENFQYYFARTDATLDGAPLRADAVYSATQVARILGSGPALARRYALGEPAFAGAANARRWIGYGLDYRWYLHDERFDCARHPNEGHRFGWIVEIDPADSASIPVKRTALGRFRHESATVALAVDQRVVVYSGDDDYDEYLYKFVSHDRYQPALGKANGALLDQGDLYVARFEANGSGRWLKLAPGVNGLSARGGFGTLAEVLINARGAADVAGGTKLDRAEWVAVDPRRGEVYVACTNNGARTAADAANPRAQNLYGHLLRWRETGGDAAALQFRWEVFAQCGEAAAGGDIKGDLYGCPDGLHIDSAGMLWVSTDIAGNLLNSGPFRALGNNALLCVDPATREVRRFLTAPRGAEVTGMFMSTDRRSMFVNLQHPGEGLSVNSDPATPRAVSNWPDYRPDGRPRSATVVVRRRDGEPIS